MDTHGFPTSQHKGNVLSSDGHWTWHWAQLVGVGVKEGPSAPVLPDLNPLTAGSWGSQPG